MATITLLYSSFLAVIQRNPELARYQRQITGSCCRPPDDATLRKKIAAFLVYHPGYKAMLEPLIVEKPDDAA